MAVMLETNTKISDYLLLLATIAVSGVPFFTTSILYMPLFAILLFVFLLRKETFDISFLLIIISLVIITAIQSYVFNFFSLQTSVGVFLRVLTAYLLIKILKDKFIPYFIQTLYVIAIISLPFYLLISLSPAVVDVLKEFSNSIQFLNISEQNLPTIIVYNLYRAHEIRNTGPFWEPGAFAGFLVLALMFNEFVKSQKRNKVRIVLLITILTTFSTTGYLALSVFLAFYFFTKVKSPLTKLIVILLIPASGYLAYTNLDFLGKKIDAQIERATSGADPYKKDLNTQRFLNVLRDVIDFKGHETVGRGSNPITRYSYNPDQQIRTVGLTDILVRMGLPFTLLMLVLLYHSISYFLRVNKQYSLVNTLGVFLAILVTLTSEVYFNFPFYWCLLFLHFAYKETYEEMPLLTRAEYS
jgi:hypothetical protein